MTSNPILNLVMRTVKAGPVLLILLTIALLHSCAPLPPVEELPDRSAQVASPQDTLTAAERDSIILVTRSFAHERYKNGDYETARKHFLTLRYYDRDHKQNFYRYWADCFIRAGMLDSAVYAFEEGVKYFPEDEHTRVALAIMYRNERRYDEAIAQQSAAVRLKPDSLRYYQDLEAIYEAAERWDDAIATLQSMVNRWPDDKGLRERLTNLIRSRRSPEEYLAELKRSLEAAPDDPELRLRYATELSSQGMTKEATAEMEEYLKAKPADAGVWRQLGHSRADLGDWNGAIAALRKALDLEPKNASDAIEISRNYLALNNWSEARRWGARALDLEPGNGVALNAMAEAYFRSADAASGDNIKFNDKLVFAIAYGLYQRAAVSGNPQARSDGERGMRSLVQSELIPSKEDRFMSKANRPTGKAYDWIDPSWPEVQALDKFLSGLD
ncbi:MAG: tetratricopeptide repeat protein [Calditrichaeota bacterium]|nr:tetratricopeptide repeat protein [Calditrichota bacterium]